MFIGEWRQICISSSTGFMLIVSCCIDEHGFFLAPPACGLALVQRFTLLFWWLDFLLVAIDQRRCMLTAELLYVIPDVPRRAMRSFYHRAQVRQQRE